MILILTISLLLAKNMIQRKGIKCKEGYFPGVAAINDYIVCFENRNGNSNVKFKQAETLQSAYIYWKRKRYSLTEAVWTVVHLQKKS